MDRSKDVATDELSMAEAGLPVRGSLAGGRKGRQAGMQAARLAAAVEECRRELEALQQEIVAARNEALSSAPVAATYIVLFRLVSLAHQRVAVIFYRVLFT